MSADNGFTHGKAYTMAPGVQRITAPNPGMMTGPGTNTYLVGEAEVAVIDPGVNDTAHLDAIEAAAPGPIKWILITHAHPDHSPGARELSQRTGAPVYAHPTQLKGVRDEDFRPDKHLNEGDVISGADLRLRCLHTPGHAADHLCFLREDDGLLFAGDHVMDSVTVVIAPPDGDMGAYLQSLERLQQEPVKIIAPAHGDLMKTPGETIANVIAHRLQREQQVVNLLADGVSDVDALVTRIYQDVPKALHPVAAWQITAHLLKLQLEGQVDRKGQTGSWHLIGQSRL